MMTRMLGAIQPDYQRCGRKNCTCPFYWGSYSRKTRLLRKRQLRRTGW